MPRRVVRGIGDLKAPPVEVAVEPVADRPLTAVEIDRLQAAAKARVGLPPGGNPMTEADRRTIMQQQYVLSQELAGGGKAAAARSRPARPAQSGPSEVVRRPRTYGEPP